VTSYEFVLVQALELDEDERELLGILVMERLETRTRGSLPYPSLVSELERRSKNADEHWKPHGVG
jgi:hypothetical protein